jgi:hypothetical protein
MTTQLTYVIRFVADMPAATAFFHDALGVTLRFQSPGWTEFETGTTTLALPCRLPLGNKTECLLLNNVAGHSSNRLPG